MPILAAITLAIGPFIAASTDPAPALSCRSFIDFSDEQEFARWRVVNDGVMGGLSSGEITQSEGEMSYRGMINTNGGGFSSVRRAVQPGTLAGVEALRFTYQGDGRPYKVSLRSSARYRGIPISFQAIIPPSSEGAVVSFTDLRASLRGRRVTGASFDPAATSEIGLILADGLDGPFEMALRSIELCTTRSVA